MYTQYWYTISMKVDKLDHKYVEAVIANWIRKNTKKSQGHFFPTRQLFKGVNLDYENKKHYRYVMQVIHQWRNQAGFFWDYLVAEGKINSNGKYNEQNFDAFLKDWNDTGSYYLVSVTRQTDEGDNVYGFHQPDLPQEKMRVDQDKLLKYTKQIKNRFNEMI